MTRKIWHSMRLWNGQMGMSMGDSLARVKKYDQDAGKCGVILSAISRNSGFERVQENATVLITKVRPARSVWKRQVRMHLCFLRVC
jgi:hypothetical protein